MPEQTPTRPDHLGHGMLLTYDRMACTYYYMSADLLLGGAARRGILARSFLTPDREFYLRELARDTGLAVRSIQVELDRLREADLLLERRDGNRRYFRANQSHPLFRPVREIVLKTDGLASVLQDALGNDGVDLALVYGSIAAESATAASDIDLLIVGSLGLRAAVRRLRPAQDTLGREINPNVWTSSEYQQRLATHDPFLRRILDGPTLKVIG